jgi:hypothetical protein
MEHLISEGRSKREPEAWKAHADRVIDLAQRQMLASLILRGPSRLKLFRSLWRRCAFLLLLLIMVYGVPTALAKLLDPSVTFFTAARIMSAVICVVALMIEDYLRRTFFAENVFNVYKYARNEETRERYDHWFDCIFSRKLQFGGALVFMMIPLVPLVLLDWAAGNHLNAASYLVAALCLFACSHGAYFALVMPLLASIIAKGDMEMFWINPADTSWIKTLSFGLSMLTLSEAFAMALGMPVIYLLRSMKAPNQAFISGVWLAIALCVIIYGYLYPHFHLYRVISAEKDRQIQAVQKIIDSHRDRLEAIGEDERRRLWQFVDLNDRLSRARESAFDNQIVTGLVTSLILPIGGFILTHKEALSFLGSLTGIYGTEVGFDGWSL